MSELVIAQSQGDPAKNPGIQLVARTPTFTLLRRLDPPRQRALLHFLRDSQIFSTTDTVITLHDADLRDVSLRKAYLSGVDLRNADLGFADLTGANLSNADLGGATLKAPN